MSKSDLRFGIWHFEGIFQALSQFEGIFRYFSVESRGSEEKQAGKKKPGKAGKSREK